MFNNDSILMYSHVVFHFNFEERFSKWLKMLSLIKTAQKLECDREYTNENTLI